MVGRGMQDCFRAHPEVYASELEDEEDEIEEELRAREAAKSEGEPAHTDAESSSPAEATTTQPEANVVGVKAPESKTPTAATSQSADKEVELVPKAAHDASSG